MSRSKLGELPESAFETDIIIDSTLDKRYGPEFHAEMDKMQENIRKVMAATRAKKRNG